MACAHLSFVHWSHADRPCDSCATSTVSSYFDHSSSYSVRRLSHQAGTCCRYWTLAADQPEAWQHHQPVLPSDCRSRIDLAALAIGSISQAQSYKEELENLQRADGKLRKVS